MFDVTELIHELDAATQQMRQATIADDWLLAGKIQKRRAQMVAQIVEYSHASSLTVTQIHDLQAVREVESLIAARASARHQALGQALSRIWTGVRQGMLERMLRAYRASDPRRS